MDKRRDEQLLALGAIMSLRDALSNQSTRLVLADQHALAGRLQAADRMIHDVIVQLCHELGV